MSGVMPQRNESKETVSTNIYMHMITWFLKKCKWCADKILKLESFG